MDPLLEQIAGDLKRTGAPRPGEAVLAMVSGGADSLLLLHCLHALHRGRLGVLTVDHGLRAAAAAECDAVEAAARALGRPVTRVRLALPPGSAVQQRARDARYAAARAVARRDGWDVIATGHTRSDQAETVLMRLARGAGRTGALAMAPRAGDIVRPLLGVSAAEVRAWCKERGLRPAEDPSNRDPAGARVRARRLVRDLEAVSPGAEGHLAAFADLLRDEAALLAPLVDAAWARCAAGEGLAVAALRAEDPALARLLVRRLVASAGLSADACGSAAVRRVLDVLDGPARTGLPGGAVAGRAGGVLWVTPAGGRVPGPAAAPLAVPGRVPVPGGAVTARRGDAVLPTPARVALRVEGPLLVRAVRPGDRIALSDGGRASVTRVLARRGVPSTLRHRVPVVVAGGRVVWVAGHRAAADVLAREGRGVIVLELEAA